MKGLSPEQRDEYNRVMGVLEDAIVGLGMTSPGGQITLPILAYALLAQAAGATSTCHRYGVAEFSDLDKIIAHLLEQFEAGVRINVRDLYDGLEAGASFDFRDGLGAKS